LKRANLGVATSAVRGDYEKYGETLLAGGEGDATAELYP
jgi:hypothetical protein